jgi:beta-galactosidase
MLGVCYYPEHWPEAIWANDAARMAELGLRYVRIGEFAWSRIEPNPGDYHWDWLDRAIETLGGAGLRVVLCTPSATPPKWLIDAHPDILPVDPATGRTRGFGSRRHTDFSSGTWTEHALRITEQLARRYGQHRHVAGWQTDNELCCHDTTLSASPAALAGFRAWLRARYGSIDALNAAWGNVFWSMEYREFEEIEHPVGAVTETSPAHRLAWRRHASDTVVRFHADMVAVLRKHAPGRFITHNFIPMDETGVDNHALAAPLDFAAYDNYPLGRTDLAMAGAPAAEFAPWMRTGHPDLQSIYFDQTRGLTGKPFWIMEQQPGPVNWGRHNPWPAPGMVRLWSWEAFAHGAAVVSFFRWRQAPFAQEQMHAGLLRPDSTPAEAWPQIERLAAELAQIPLPEPTRAPAAIIVDTEAEFLSAIEQQGRGYDYTAVLHAWYRALRRLGIDVDFVAPGADVAGYRLVLAPCLAMPSAAAVAALTASDAIVLIGPRSGAKTAEFTIPAGLPPGPLQSLLPIRVLAVDCPRPDCPGEFRLDGRAHGSIGWRESVDAGDAEVLATLEDGKPALLRRGRAHYLATLTDEAGLDALFTRLATAAQIAITPVSGGLRLRRRGDLVFAINYGPEPATAPAPAAAEFLLGGHHVPAHDLAIWRLRPCSAT